MDKRTVKLTRVKGKLWLKCRNCSNKWYPDARKWRAKNPDVDKILRCPKCNVKNRVPRTVVKYLIKQEQRAIGEPEWGFDEG